MKIQLSQFTATIMSMFFLCFNPLVSYAYDYGNDMEVLKEQFKKPFMANQQEVDFRDAWLKLIDDGLQKRDPEKLRWSNFLSHLARKRAEDYVRYTDQWEGHVDQMGKHATDWGSAIGYDQGSIESLAYNRKAEDALDAFLNSPRHRTHLLGEEYYQNDSSYAIGFAGLAEGKTVYVFITSNESERHSEVVETTLKPIVPRFEDKVSYSKEYDTVFIIYEVRNLDPGEYSAEWSEDFSSWEKFYDLTIEKNEDRWRKVTYATVEEQVYLRIVKKPTVTSAEPLEP